MERETDKRDEIERASRIKEKKLNREETRSETEKRREESREEIKIERRSRWRGDGRTRQF